MTAEQVGGGAADDWIEQAPLRRRLQRKLLAWFDQHARDLPWRRSRQLYHVWVSEVMLQQTQVATVIGYFERFIEQFPDVRALAQAKDERVLRAWEGLGYYRRARQLHEAARLIVERHAGELPTTFDELCALPGIGRYTAGAILSIALDQRHPILEANTLRLLSRLLALRDDPRKAAAQRRLWEVAEQLLPERQVGRFNQALMELGSKICTPVEPLCDTCPAAAVCAARQLQLQHAIPPAAPRTTYEQLSEAAVVVRRQQRVALRRCAAGERWAGLWDFPRFAFDPTRPSRRQLAAGVARLTGITIRAPRPLTVLRHGVTRYRITLYCHVAAYAGHHRDRDDLRWVRLDDIHRYPLSSTGRKITRLLG